MIGMVILAAIAQAAAPAPIADPAGQQNAKPKLVCKSERLVGSLIPTRICRSAAQWAIDEKQSQEDLESQKRYSRAASN